jgi:hypothetical protein
METANNNENFNRHIHDFSRKVDHWDIELQDLNIEKPTFYSSVKDQPRKRSQTRVGTATRLFNMFCPYKSGEKAF